MLRTEKRYYERIIAYSRDRLMLFPYHLADMICKGLRITPFSYYISVVEKLMQAEKSYDTLPNFTAADCLRLLNIGRNEYIELMNRSRSNRGRLFGKQNVRGLLPPVPCDVHIEPWWRVEVGLVLEDDIKVRIRYGIISIIVAACIFLLSFLYLYNRVQCKYFTVRVSNLHNYKTKKYMFNDRIVKLK